MKARSHKHHLDSANVQVDGRSKSNIDDGGAVKHGRVGVARRRSVEDVGEVRVGQLLQLVGGVAYLHGLGVILGDEMDDDGLVFPTFDEIPYFVVLHSVHLSTHARAR